MPEKKDRRVKYTEMVIKESLIEILATKPISKITIKEICERADVNRATFYAHYTDHYALLDSIEDELFQQINAYIDQYPFGMNTTVLSDMLTKVFEYIYKNGKLCSVLLGQNSEKNMERCVAKMLNDRFFTAMSKKMGRDEAEYLQAYIIAGSIAIIRKWVDEGMNKSPRDISQLIADITNDGMKGFRLKLINK